MIGIEAGQQQGLGRVGSGALRVDEGLISGDLGRQAD